MPAKPLLLTEAVNQLLKGSDVPAALNIEQCADALAMSITSFRRKLAQEETSYKLIQTKFLNELCVSALLTQSLKIDELAIKLGYSERATFERAFRQKFGLTPAQFRELSKYDDAKSHRKKLIDIAQNIPPMPDSCRQLLEEKEQGNLDLERVVDIVSHDPIFSGRIMGQASKAIYGKTPRDIKEAIGRNLGINSVVNFAVVFAMKDALQAHVEPVIIERYSDAFLLAPKLFQRLRKSVVKSKSIDIAITEQTLAFGLLGIFLLCHKEAEQHSFVLHAIAGIEELESLNSHVKACAHLSLFSASTLMLSLWHIDAVVIKQLTHLDRVTGQMTKRSEQDELILFMLTCLYQHAVGHGFTDGVFEKAELLGIADFADITRQVFNA